MSIANNRLTRHRKPKITRLPEGRLQVERWFRIESEVDAEGTTRLTERIFGGYGLLDGTTATDFEKTEFPASAFADCRLIEENTDEQFTQSGQSFHILYQKYQTLTDAFALEEADKSPTTENGLKTLVRTQVALPGTALPALTVGSNTITVGSKTLYLASIDDDSSDDRRARLVTQWAEAGLLAIRPIKEGGFTLAQSYIYTSQGVPPSTLHAAAALPKPGGNTLAANATFLEPEVQNVEGFPQFSQLVISAALPEEGDPEVKIHSKEDFFDVVEPGVMGLDDTVSGGSTSGTTDVFPKAVSTPRRYRKKGTVDVFLTTSNTISETEVAFTEEGVTWAHITFINGFIDFDNASAKSSGRWREFSNYLIDPNLEPNPPLASGGQAGVYLKSFGDENGSWFTFSKAEYGGDTTYEMSGIYRVSLKEYEKGPDGTQYYLKTVVTFS